MTCNRKHKISCTNVEVSHTEATFCAHITFNEAERRGRGEKTRKKKKKRGRKGRGSSAPAAAGDVK